PRAGRRARQAPRRGVPFRPCSARPSQTASRAAQASRGGSGMWRRELVGAWKGLVTRGFDDGNSVHYDAPAMSGSLHAWYSLRDLEALGQRHATLDGEIELSKLIRLAGLLH